MKNHQKNLKTMKTETTFSNNLINSTIFHLLNFEKYTDFQQAARQAAINNNFQIVLFSEEFNVLFSVETRHERTIEEASAAIIVLEASPRSVAIAASKAAVKPLMVEASASSAILPS